MVGGAGSASAGRMKVRSVYRKNPWLEWGHSGVGGAQTGMEETTLQGLRGDGDEGPGQADG